MESGAERGRVALPTRRGASEEVLISGGGVSPPRLAQPLRAVGQQPCKCFGRCGGSHALRALVCRFTHDAVRRRDKVYVTDTAEGRVAQLRFPGLELVRSVLCW